MSKRVVLGVTGSIAAYKAAELVRKMTAKSWDVWVMMTEAATKYVGPLTFHALTGHPVAAGKCEATPASAFEHLDLASCDALVIAPCTANVIAKLAHGLADDVVTSTALACTAPLIVAPAMNEKMWSHPATQANVETLRRRGVKMIDVERGALACGVVGLGRLAELDRIADEISRALGA